MSNLPLTITDFVALGVVFLSGFLAYFRGAVREFFFLATWGGAIAATIYLYHPLLPYVSRWITSDPLLGALATAAIIFVATLTVLTVISVVAVRHTEDSPLSVLDRTLGFVFGLVRGAVVICLIYLLYTLMAPVSEQPKWLRQAKLTPVVAEGARVMLALAPADWGLQGKRVAQQLKDTSSAIQPLVNYNNLVDPKTTTPDTGKAAQPGYNNIERKALDNVIKSNQ